MSKYKVTLILQGELVQNLNFVPYAKDWWILRPTHNDLAYTLFYPNNFEPGYIYQSEALRSNICQSSSEAVTSIYQQAFSTKTRLDGLLVMGYDDSEICKMLLSDIYFHPYAFKIGNMNLTIFGIESNLIELTTKLQEIYPPNYIIKDRELHAWRALLQYTGCTNIAPFGKESKQLYESGYLSTTPENHENVAEQFWNAFQDALDVNIRGIDGKRRILSIIADKIPYDAIKKKSQTI
ncbi:hypothetical protein C2G38_2215480 [Gigaspora rosea]|uniref:Uncharacterized protein n=1 Tax=Gigaspora rosea TaxID=44941 RepID=A0A397UIC8_9GLOM|nr:hypothetical protein C2G38_2215480 [Gigaspora rosea]